MTTPRSVRWFNFLFWFALSLWATNRMWDMIQVLNWNDEAQSALRLASTILPMVVIWCIAWYFIYVRRSVIALWVFSTLCAGSILSFLFGLTERYQITYEDSYLRMDALIFACSSALCACALGLMFGREAKNWRDWKNGPDLEVFE